LTFSFLIRTAKVKRRLLNRISMLVVVMVVVVVVVVVVLVKMRRGYEG